MVRNKSTIYIIALSLLLMASTWLLADDDRAGEELGRQVISNGGNSGSSTSYQLSGTVNQTAVGVAVSGSNTLSHGFWQYGAMPCQGLCGDSNYDGFVNISDAVHIIMYVFSGGSAPQPIQACGDTNEDGYANISDAVFIINYVFTGGSAPGDCGAGLWGGNDCCPYISPVK